MGSHGVQTHWMYQYNVLCLAWWWFNEPKHVAEFLILITNTCGVIDWINYYIIAKHNGMAPIKELFWFQYSMSIKCDCCHTHNKSEFQLEPTLPITACYIRFLTHAVSFWLKHRVTCAVPFYRPFWVCHVSVVPFEGAVFSVPHFCVSITSYLSETGDREIKSGSKSKSKPEIKIKGRRNLENLVL